MVVSPALDRLLSSPRGELLRPRLPHRSVGIIGPEGLSGPSDYRVYIGGEDLASGPNQRVIGFGVAAREADPYTPMQFLLIVVAFVVLLLPIAVFVMAAVRFGGEQRDRRLAALRLVGADAQMTKRIAAGEVLVASGLGLLCGLALFYSVRHEVERFTAFGIDAFGSDLRPSPALLALLVLGVPAAAVGVALMALRQVVRRARARRRRLWWRLVVPTAGVALIVSTGGKGGTAGSLERYEVVAGTALLLIGVTGLLPWLLEVAVRRFGGGAVSLQLVVRRLQVSSGTSARVVVGVTVAVAGAIALQMLFAAAQQQNTIVTGHDTRRADAIVTGFGAPPQVSQALARTPGVRAVARISAAMPKANPENSTAPTDPTADVPRVWAGVGDCASIAELAATSRCADGDVFRVRSPESQDRLPEPGDRLGFNITETKGVAWTVPTTTQDVPARVDPTNGYRHGLLITPGAAAAVLRTGTDASWQTTIYLQLDPAEPEAIEHVRDYSGFCG
jgi:hypothetical protein